MSAFPGCEHCVDYWACPGPVDGDETNPCRPDVNRGMDHCNGDDFDVAIGDAKHKTYRQGVCQDVGDTEATVSQEVQMWGTGGGTFSSGRAYKEPTDGNGLVVKTTYRHKNGPFGKLILPTSYKTWCQSAMNFLVLKEFYNNPWALRDHFAPLYNPAMVFAAIKASNGVEYPLEKEDGTRLHYTFDASIEFDQEGLDLEKDAEELGMWMAIKQNLMYAHIGNSTPYVPNTGMVEPSVGVSHFLDSREVMTPTLDVTLAIWVPLTVFLGNEQLKQKDFMMDKPRLSIQFKSVNFDYRARRTGEGDI